MKQYQVPQFITVEDKVIGPFTIKQFLYLGGAGVILALSRLFLAPFFFFPAALIIGSFAAALAFLKINERPFPVVIRHAVAYFLRPRLYIWQKEAPSKHESKKTASTQEITVKAFPKLSESRLSDLAWNLDIKEKLRG